MATILKTKAEFEKAIEGKAIVDFYADWCGPCRMLGPTIEELSKEYAGKINIVKVNVDNLREVAQQYGIQSIPTILFFKEKQQLGRVIGLQDKETFEKLIKEYLK
ncbi:MAG: thioredoxin [Bacilli bacterium]|jgi:thioredoxin 1|nr:thioredoxin [Bacilli bacterium]MDD3422404.1 thioredoxin [Bacilli bacterium]MDD4065607.1 thioredoxin [Bacilli bacterium]